MMPSLTSRMINIISRSSVIQEIRFICTSSVMYDTKSYKLLIVGGGAGGCAMAAKFVGKVPKGQLAVLEQSDYHYYQPYFTLIGGGLKPNVEKSRKPMQQVLPKNAIWIQDKAAQFKPKENLVITQKGDIIKYEFLIVAVGLKLKYDKIKGLPGAFEYSGIGSNYHFLYVTKTRKAAIDFKEGNALFTFPAGPIKCAGAPQKVVYITEEYFRKSGKRNKANFIYNTALPVIFGIPKYAKSLTKIAEERNVTVNFQHNLIEVRPDKREAVFELLDKPGETVTYDYEMLHVAPPCSPPDCLLDSPDIIDANGFMDVNFTTQHKRFPNVFALGDCTNLAVAKTAAAVASQCGYLRKNLQQVMRGGEPRFIYDGYSSCPLITGKRTCILAEFDANAEALETFPFDQGREMWTMAILKRDIMPHIYWQMLLKGWWEGPRVMRKALHFGMSR